jgi:ribosomal protein S18 acetylase RimI-like enzyme
MGVRLDWRCRGIGASLLCEALRRAARAGYPSLYLSVNIDNPQAARLYERVGFQFQKRFTLYRKELSLD